MLSKLTILIENSSSKEAYILSVYVGRYRYLPFSVAEPVGAEVFWLVGAGADLNFSWSRSRGFFGSAPAPLFSKWKTKWFKDVHFSLYKYLQYCTGTNFCIINSTCWLYLQVSKKLDNFLRLSKSIFSKLSSFLGQNQGYWSFYLLKFIFFKCFVSKSVFLRRSLSEPSFYRWSRSRSRSRNFVPGAGAPLKKYLEPEPRKNGSAPKH